MKEERSNPNRPQLLRMAEHCDFATETGIVERESQEFQFAARLLSDKREYICETVWQFRQKERREKNGLI